MNRSGTWKRISRNWGLYLLLLPSLVLLILFAYKPMYGVVIAFKNYKNSLGILGSPWAEPLFKNFQRFFNSYQCEATIRNTLRLSLYSLAVGFPIPIILALMINQITAMRFRRTFQTILYLPHFISTVVMVGLLLIWLSPSSGLVGAFYRLLGKDAPNVMTSASGFPSIYVWSDVWQHSGWDSIVFLAALSSIDPTLYEAATVDGATRWQKMRYIDLPLLMSTACIMLILRAGNLMNVGFEKVFLMQNDLNMSTSEIIATYVYKMGLRNSQYAVSTAVNLFNNLVNFVLLLLVNCVTRKLGETSLF
ncbi:MAG: ABC transporter permease subunit [Candidatus Limiplasma sp.]|jgi:putative aldouronate transport system permease protein|nr:ABC transporter permease subunit [Clostridiales bacterium]MDY3243657.1 ABC transporter permease subunit [Candidatus Limiplasma sp.]MDY4063292.1 ABC transporter permease subunit [Candidatus Limiplasma sp.]